MTIVIVLPLSHSPFARDIASHSFGFLCFSLDDNAYAALKLDCIWLSLPMIGKRSK